MIQTSMERLGFIFPTNILLIAPLCLLVAQLLCSYKDEMGKDDGEMLVLEENWGTIPLLHVVPEGKQKEALPTVLFLHGFTSAKEHNLHYAYNLASKGLRVLLPDALLHGKRSKGLDEVQLSLSFWEIVLTSIEEVAYIKKQANEQNLLYGNTIGLAGTSMGGITTLGCLSQYEWIKVAAVMMGAPGYVELAKAQIAQFEKRGFQIPLSTVEREKLLHTLTTVDLTKQPEKLSQRPLFFWHGENDSTVPFEPTYSFYQSVKALYVDAPERLVFMQDELAGHAVSRVGMLKSTEWLATYLNGD